MPGNESIVTLPSDRVIKVERRFDAPLHLVYRAFVEPELIRRWLTGYDGWSMPVCEVDLRVGGAYHYRWRSDESGEEFGLLGTFHRIEPERRLDSTERFEDTSDDMVAEVVTSFEAVGNGTRVVYDMSFASLEARDGALKTGMTDGMEFSFKKLDGILATEGAGG